MPWIALGTVRPNLLEWQVFAAPAFENLYRIRQTWAGSWPGTGYIRFREVLPDSSFYGSRRIYATQDEQLLVLPLSPVLVDAGYVLRRFEIRLSLRARIYETANWQVSIDEYTPNEDDDPFLVDGGTYVRTPTQG